ncbi:hypothetical protein BH09BAC3_BH09BAC3_07050 [soil metagenome]
MQKQIRKILTVVFAAWALSSVAAPVSPVLTRADSLYNKKQYTQALDLYKTLFSDNKYSPAMLLKMAYIHEGLGHLGESLYYLNLYYITSDDGQALRKMEEVAEKNNLEGYKTDETTHVIAWLQKHYATISYIIASVCVFLLALMLYLRQGLKINPLPAGIGLALFLAVLFFHINFNIKDQRGIVAGARTYLMDGPSAGASVIAIIGEGHQLEITGKKDVWFRVEWGNKEVYVKEFLVREIKL